MKNRNKSVWALAIGTAAFVGTEVAAQEIQLGDPIASHPEAFGLVSGVRELADGRVLVADPMGVTLTLLDADLETATPLGTVGQGPGEFRQPDNVWPIGDDRTLLVDLGNARLTTVDPEGRLVDSSPIVLPSDGPRGMTMVIPEGTDASGNVYFQGSAMGGRGMRTSVEVFRYNPRTGQTSVVAEVMPPGVDRQESGGGNERQVRMVPIPMAPADVWGVTADGGVFVARADSYVVEFYGPDGSHVVGPANAFDPVRIGASEREEWQERRAREGGIGVSVSIENGQRRVSLARSPGQRGGGSDLNWPDTKPPFEDVGIAVDDQGRGWVRRSVKAGAPATYDVFDQSARRVATVVLPEARTLVSFGEGTLYAAAVDEFDQHFLERYELPALP